MGRRRNKAYQGRNNGSKKKRGARVMNQLTSSSGAGSDLDRGASYRPGRLTTSSYVRDRQNIDLWYTDWQAKKIINIPVDDMLREPWTYEGLDDQEEKVIRTSNDDLRVEGVFRDALRLERLLGGSVIFMGITDGNDNPKEPVDFSQGKTGWLKYLNIVNRERISKVEIDNNLLSPTYGRPTHYNIDAQVVHRSRLLIFPGDPLLPTPDSFLTPTNVDRNDGFGVSVLTSIYDDILRATGTRQAAFHLVNKASEMIISGDFMSLEETEAGKKKLDDLQRIADQLSIYKTALLDKNPGEGIDVTTNAAAFGSVPELLMTFVQILSAASDIPATRFLGQAPGGLNATGESDLENYYKLYQCAAEAEAKAAN